MKNFLKYSGMSLVVSGILVGCNSSSDHNTNATISQIEKVSYISGKAVDGYLLDATVCLDLNDDKSCQSATEPTTTTSSTDGSYILSLSDTHLADENYANAQVIVYGGVDKDNPNDVFKGLLSSPNDGSGKANITPLTSVVSAYLKKDSHSFISKNDIEKVIQIVADKLGIEKEYVTKNPLLTAGDNRDLLKVNLQLQKALESLKTADTNLKDNTIYEAFAVGLDSIAKDDGVMKMIENAPKSKLGLDAFKTKKLAIVSASNVKKTFETLENKTTEYIVNALRVQQNQIIKDIKDLDLDGLNVEAKILAIEVKRKLSASKLNSTDFKEEMAYQIIEDVYVKSGISFVRESIDVSTLKDEISFKMNFLELNELFQDDEKVGSIAKDAIKLQTQSSNSGVLNQSSCSQKIGNDLAFVDSPPTQELPWTQEGVDVEDIESAFNKARGTDTTVVKELKMPSQIKWNGLDDNEKALFLLNKERSDRGIKPFEGISVEVKNVAQDYAKKLYDNNATGHYFDDENPKGRLYKIQRIVNNEDSFNFSENIYIAKSTNESIAKAIYNWIYIGSETNWVDRKFCLANGLNDNSGESGAEGLIGIGIMQGSNYSALDGETSVVVLNAFDPGEDWEHNTTKRVSACIAGVSAKFTKDEDQSVIIDTVSNLMWQNESPIKSDSEFRFAINVQDAKDKCRYMGADVLASSNYTDWRLSTKFELDAFNAGIQRDGISLNTHWVGTPTEVSDGMALTSGNGKYAYRCVRDVKKANDLKLLTDLDVTPSNEVEVEVQGKAGAEIYLNDGIEILKKATLDSNGSAIITLDTSGEDGYKSFNLTQKEDEIEIGDKLVIKIEKDTKALQSGAKLDLQTNVVNSAILPDGQLSTNSTTPTLLVYSNDENKPWFFLSKVKAKVDGKRYTSIRRDSDGYFIIPISDPLTASTYDVEISVSDYAGNTRITVFTEGLKIN